MQEDKLELMEKTFPNGFLMIVPDDNDKAHLRIALSKGTSNPHLVLLLAYFKVLIDEWSKHENNE